VAEIVGDVPDLFFQFRSPPLRLNLMISKRKLLGLSSFVFSNNPLCLLFGGTEFKVVAPPTDFGRVGGKLFFAPNLLGDLQCPCFGP